MRDTKDGDGFRHLVTNDMAINTTAADESVITSADESIVFLVDVPADAVTAHQGHMSEIG